MLCSDRTCSKNRMRDDVSQGIRMNVTSSCGDIVVIQFSSYRADSRVAILFITYVTCW